MAAGATVAVAGAVGSGVALAGGPAKVADRLGIDPVPQTVPRDAELLTQARADHVRLLLLAGTAPDGVRRALDRQLQALGGVPSGGVADGTPLATAVRAAADERLAQALDATSPALVRTLLSVAAGLQVLTTQVPT